jgi:PAS domain-containing protein
MTAEPTPGIFQEGGITQLYEKMLAMNEALLLGSLRQHELTEVADSLNARLQAEISERKQAEEVLRKNKRQYDNLVSRIPVGIYISHITPGGVLALDYLSPRMAEMFSASAESLLADPQILFQAIHPDDLDAFVTSNQGGSQHRHPVDWIGRVLAGGTVKWLRIVSSP